VAELTSFSPDDERWRVFAQRYATSPFQNPAWLDTLVSAYGLTTQIRALTDSAGSILALLPMTASKLPWRNRRISLPFTDTVEPIAVDAVRRDELLVAIAQEASPPVVVRTHVDLPGWFSRQVGTVQCIDLSAGAEGALREAAGNTRRHVQRAMRPATGLSARPLCLREEFISDAVEVVSRSRRRLGVPTQPRRFWSRMWELHERGHALTIGAYKREELVALGVFLVGSTHAVHKYSASDLATRHLGSNYLVLATAFESLANRGVETLDFGVTDLRNASLRRFKRHWGGAELPARFSATDPSALPNALEPSRLLAMTIRQSPAFVGRTVGSLAYPLVA